MCRKFVVYKLKVTKHQSFSLIAGALMRVYIHAYVFVTFKYLKIEPSNMAHKHILFDRHKFRFVYFNSVSLIFIRCVFFLCFAFIVSTLFEYLLISCACSMWLSRLILSSISLVIIYDMAVLFLLFVFFLGGFHLSQSFHLFALTLHNET